MKRMARAMEALPMDWFLLLDPQVHFSFSFFTSFSPLCRFKDLIYLPCSSFTYPSPSDLLSLASHLSNPNSSSNRTSPISVNFSSVFYVASLSMSPLYLYKYLFCRSWSLLVATNQCNQFHDSFRFDVWVSADDSLILLTYVDLLFVFAIRKIKKWERI